MNAVEHYVEAERLMHLSLTQWATSEESDPFPLAALTMQQAQVHATLAQAAAIASLRLPAVDGFESIVDRDYRGWGAALGES